MNSKKLQDNMMTRCPECRSGYVQRSTGSIWLCLQCDNEFRKPAKPSIKTRLNFEENKGSPDISSCPPDRAA